MLEEFIMIDLIDIYDKYCRFYYDVFVIIYEIFKIVMSEEIFSFLVIWVGINDRWYGVFNINMMLVLWNVL